MYEIKNNNGHYELYVNGTFYCSADTFTEAAKEIDSLIYKKVKEEDCNGNAIRWR